MLARKARFELITAPKLALKVLKVNLGELKVRSRNRLITNVIKFQ